MSPERKNKFERNISKQRFPNELIDEVNVTHTPNRCSNASKSEISSIINQSELYKVQEEFVFIFGGQLSECNGKGSFNNSVEVFDVQREICREFHNFDDNESCAKGAEVCKPLSHFHAV